MQVFKTKSINPNITDEQLERGCKTVSFLSFERAIRETNQLAGIKDKEVNGYQVTEQGINIIWK